MPKRRGVKKNMELRKFFITLILINFTSNLNAEIISPSKNLTPYDVVKVQLNALKNNDKLSKDLGIKQVWSFAHPENRKITGPYERFRAMIYSGQYNLLINHTSHKIDLLMKTSKKYIYKVEILTKEKKLYFYEWHVEKGSDEKCNDCWFTSAVSIPVDQGNTI
jgi:hypothetical protein|tara:strand:+ start:540 stop:1031 length:492 start_codon:yes stop_codon:yes gene_type:complete